MDTIWDLAIAKVHQALRLDRPSTETVWVSLSDSRRVAVELFEKGRLLEYECFDNEGKGQGRACLELIEWINGSEGFFGGHHVSASDEYYEWYASQSLLPADNCVYHLCSSDPTGFRGKPKRGDRREVVHIGRWRLLSPLVMVDAPYLAGEGERIGRIALGPPGTGLDGALAHPPLPPPELEVAKEKRKKKSRSRSPRKGSKGVAGYLRERAEAHHHKRDEEPRRGRKKEKDKKEKKGKEARRKARGIDDSSSSGEESSLASSGFRVAPARGGDDLRRLAQKKPGKLLEESLKEMARFLAEREEEEGGLERPKGHGLRGSGDAGDPPSREDRHKESPRGDKPGDGLRLAPSGEASGVRGPFGPAAESLRNELRRRELEFSQTPGADPRDGGDDDQSKRKGADSQSGAPGPEAEASASKGQIGNWQRREGGLHSCRESPRAEDAIEEPIPRRSRTRSASSEVSGRSKSYTPRRKERGCLESSSSSRGERYRRRVREEKERKLPELPGPRGGKGGKGEKRKRATKGLVEAERWKGKKERKREVDEEKSDTLPFQCEDSESEPKIANLEGLKDWLQSQVPSKLSAAQAGLHLLHQILRSNGDLAEYVRRSLLEEPNEEEAKRWRNLLPLPLWPDVWNEMYQVLDEGCYKHPPAGKKTSTGSKSKAARNLRLSGMLVWHGLVVICLNFESTACRTLPRRAGLASVGQERCLLRIWESVKRFVDEKGSEKGMGAPRTPDVDWGKEVERLRVSYTGEVVEKARPLTLRQILPGLPSAQHGAIVPLLDVKAVALYLGFCFASSLLCPWACETGDYID